MAGWVIVGLIYQAFNIKGGDAPAASEIVENIDAGRYELALEQLADAEEFEELTGVGIDMAWIWNERGYIYSQLGRLEDAVIAHTAAISLDPTDAAAHHGRGIALEELGQLEEAQADFTAALKLEPDNPKRHRERALFYANTFDFEAAVTDMTNALDLEPTPENYVSRANFYAILGEIDLAMDDLQTVLGLPGTNQAKTSVEALFEQLGNDGVRELLTRQSGQVGTRQS